MSPRGSTSGTSSYPVRSHQQRMVQWGCGARLYAMGDEGPDGKELGPGELAGQESMTFKETLFQPGVPFLRST